MATVFVDAENVRRSVWPNIPRDELVELVGAWGEREGVRPVVVFEGVESADDRIARETAELDGPYWLVTSDRGLREGAAARAERVIGGGTFVRELTRSPGEQTTQGDPAVDRYLRAAEGQRDD